MSSRAWWLCLTLFSCCDGVEQKSQVVTNNAVARFSDSTAFDVRAGLTIRATDVQVSGFLYIESAGGLGPRVGVSLSATELTMLFAGEGVPAETLQVSYYDIYDTRIYRAGKISLNGTESVQFQGSFGPILARDEIQISDDTSAAQLEVTGDLRLICEWQVSGRQGVDSAFSSELCRRALSQVGATGTPWLR